MPVMLVCTSHTPLALIRPRAPEGEGTLILRRESISRSIEGFDPELVIVFGGDHFAGFHYSVMPPYCIGLVADAVGDLGGFAGPLRVDADEGVALIEALRQDGFDPAVSYKMRVDHAISQPLQLLTGSLQRYPVIPIFMSVFTPPFPHFRRSRAFGESVGHFIQASGKRVLVLGTGGLSHHPAHLFPLMGSAAPDVHSWQLEGARSELMDESAWFKRFELMHVAGAETASSGARTLTDMRVNPELDQSVLASLRAGDTRRFDDWKAEDVIEEAGVGMLELHSWIAAVAAFNADSSGSRVESMYLPAVEYGTGYGLLNSVAA